MRKKEITWKEEPCIYPELGNCYICTSHATVRGYPVLRYNGKVRRMNRVVYEINYGKFDDNMLVCHYCDNPSCINPKHLFLGNSKDNMQDKIKKNRANSPYSINHWNAKLTIEQIELIKKDTRKLKDIARDYNISFQHVSDIRNNKKHKR